MDSFVFFDLDGTLTDPAEGITACIRYALFHAGAPIPDAARLLNCIGPPLQETFADFLHATDPGLVEQAIGKYRERFEAVGMFENRVYEGIVGELTKLKERGYRLCVATSKPQVYAEKILRHFDLESYFDHVFGPDLEGNRREKAALLSHALDVTGTAPTRALMIGDRKHDMVGARSNYIRALGVLWGFGSRDELHASGADAVVDDVLNLTPAITSLHPAPL